jgi:outer membrane receptor for ferrienterochelin and colicins
VEGTALKFIYGQAFRVPNVYELFYAVAPQAASPMLRPERIKTTEAIWEQQLPKHLSLSTSGFYTRMKDLISQVELQDGTLVNQNLQAVDSTGVEMELSGEMRPGGSWVASYEYQQTTDDATHQLLSNSPRTLGKLTVAQDLIGRRLTASVDAQYRSRVESTDWVSVSPFAVANVTLLARNLGRRVDLSASVYNVLDKKYADPGTGATVQEEIPQDGRSFRVQMTVRLGKQ